MTVQQISFEIHLTEMTFKPINIADRNVVRPAEFCVPNLADLVSLMHCSNLYIIDPQLCLSEALTINAKCLLWCNIFIWHIIQDRAMDDNDNCPFLECSKHLLH